MDWWAGRGTRERDEALKRNPKQCPVIHDTWNEPRELRDFPFIERARTDFDIDCIVCTGRKLSVVDMNMET